MNNEELTLGKFNIENAHYNISGNIDIHWKFCFRIIDKLSYKFYSELRKNKKPDKEIATQNQMFYEKQKSAYINQSKNR